MSGTISTTGDNVAEDQADDLGNHASALRVLQAYHLAALTRAVHEARLRQVSWRAVGRGLGVSGSAAFRRFRWLDDEPVSVGVELVEGQRVAYVTSERTGAHVSRARFSAVEGEVVEELRCVLSAVPDELARRLAIERVQNGPS